MHYNYNINFFTMHIMYCACTITLCCAGKGGGSRGFERTPLLTSNFIYTSKMYILSILPFERGPLVSLLLRITAALVAATVFMGDQRARTRA